MESTYPFACQWSRHDAWRRENFVVTTGRKGCVFCSRSIQCKKQRKIIFEIIEQIEREILLADNLIKTKIGARDKRGINNPMFGKKHSNETKEKIR